MTVTPYALWDGGVTGFVDTTDTLVSDPFDNPPAENDVIVLVVMDSSSASNVFVPTGFTEVFTDATTITTGIYYMVCDGTEEDIVVITGDIGDLTLTAVGLTSTVDAVPTLVGTPDTLTEHVATGATQRTMSIATAATGEYIPVWAAGGRRDNGSQLASVAYTTYSSNIWDHIADLAGQGDGAAEATLSTDVGAAAGAVADVVIATNPGPTFQGWLSGAFMAFQWAQPLEDEPSGPQYENRRVTVHALPYHVTTSILRKVFGY